MATFMEKEGLMELANGIAADISRVNRSFDDFCKNTDLIKARQILKEISDIDYLELNFEKFKKEIDEIKKPYNKIEKALWNLAEKGINISFNTNSKIDGDEKEFLQIKEALDELKSRDISISCDNSNFVSTYKRCFLK